jgi:hypothetical protein
MKKVSELQDYSPDLTHFIRSMQRLEGNPDCFRRTNQDCDRGDCVWRAYCLEASQEYPAEKKEISDENDRDFVR